MKTVQVNGVSLAYAEEGAGKPVILLHGNGGSHNDLQRQISQLVEAGYKVYAPDSRGQGANAALPEYHYADMAEDIFQFVRALGISRPAIYGWSDGGIVALLVEVLHPGTAGMLAVSGANASPDAMSESFKQQAREEYAETGNPLIKLMLEEPHITEEQLGGITAPVLVAAGSEDLIPLDHTLLIANSLPNSQLVIVEGEDHFSYIVESPIMGNLLVDFLEEHGY